MAGRGARRRGRLFDELGEAFALARPQFAGFVACPICLAGWTRDQAIDGMLTIEHVPPESVGGKPIGLTCKSCNNSAGASMDAAWAQYKRVLDFGQRRPTTFGARIEVDGHEQAAVVEGNEDGVLIYRTPNTSRPDDEAGLSAALDSGSPTEVHLRFVRPVDQRAAGLAVLRAAYLLALNRLGWRYILSPTFDPVRAQLLDPAVDILPRLPLAIDPPAPDQAIRVVVIEHPIELRSVAVTINQHHVFLPRPDHLPEDRFFETMPDMLAEAFGGTTFGVTGVLLDDAQAPYLLDHRLSAIDDLLRVPKN